MGHHSTALWNCRHNQSFVTDNFFLLSTPTHIQTARKQSTWLYWPVWSFCLSYHPNQMLKWPYGFYYPLWDISYHVSCHSACSKLKIYLFFYVDSVNLFNSFVFQTLSSNQPYFVHAIALKRRISIIFRAPAQLVVDTWSCWLCTLLTNE